MAEIQCGHRNRVDIRAAGSNGGRCLDADIRLSYCHTSSRINREKLHAAVAHSIRLGCLSDDGQTGAAHVLLRGVPPPAAIKDEMRGSGDGRGRDRVLGRSYPSLR